MYSIFHTSQCGSTLLGALLSKSIKTSNEPTWSHTIHRQVNPIEYINKNTKQNEIIKFPSVYCYLMPKIQGKKVFLYRSLISHINKLKDSPDLNFHLSIIGNTANEKTLGFFGEATETFIQSLLWIDRCFWTMESEDVLLINAKDLFADNQKVAKQVCDFFNIEYIPVEVNYDVKIANLNHTDEPIQIDNVQEKVNYIEPPDPVNEKLNIWVEEIVKKHPELQKFM
jgi:hypothetical protein